MSAESVHHRSVGDVEIAYEHSGSGAEPLLLIHGGTDGKSTWDEMLERIKTAIPQVTVQEFATPHGIHIDKPAEYGADVEPSFTSL